MRRCAASCGERAAGPSATPPVARARARASPPPAPPPRCRGSCESRRERGGHPPTARTSSPHPRRLPRSPCSPADRRPRRQPVPRRGNENCRETGASPRAGRWASPAARASARQPPLPPFAGRHTNQTPAPRAAGLPVRRGTPACRHAPAPRRAGHRWRRASAPPPPPAHSRRTNVPAPNRLRRGTCRARWPTWPSGGLAGFPCELRAGGRPRKA